MREAAVDRGRGVHRKDVSASRTPEVKAATLAGVEPVMGAPAKFKANARDGKVVSSAPALTVSAGDVDRNTKTKTKTPSTLPTLSKGTRNFHACSWSFAIDLDHIGIDEN